MAKFTAMNPIGKAAALNTRFRAELGMKDQVSECVRASMFVLNKRINRIVQCELSAFNIFVMYL